MHAGGHFDVALVGGVIGGVVCVIIVIVVLLIVMVIIYMCVKKRKSVSGLIYHTV